MSQITLTPKQLSALNEVAEEWAYEDDHFLTLDQRWVDGRTHIEVTVSRDDSSFVGPWQIFPSGKTVEVEV